ncbi:MAG: cadherin-like beta sandwich domain-containing protein [Lachnospiraceae bacterium]|nr:cadherin-like beta sandwich domain-containing protein [Lachnospiraceae bacterium]
MNNKAIRKVNLAVLIMAVILLLSCVFASAGSLSGDNSLSSLGITTEGAEVSPEFAYGTTEYNVTVPAGTTELSLSPTTTNSAAAIDSISGTELTDGSATVSITVVAENGDAYTYYLYVTEDESTAAAETETETEAETETETETEEETEDPRYVSVARDTLEEAENTITALKSETSSYRDRVNLLMKILYGMIGLCVVLLFAVINLLLKNHERKSELNAYRSLSYPDDPRNTENSRREKSPKQKKQKKKSRKQEREETAQTPDEEEPEQDLFDRTGRDTFYKQEQPAKRRMTDDPATVPKPSKARKQTKQMPEYEPPRENVRYEPQEKPKTDSGEVDVDFIDL